MTSPLLSPRAYAFSIQHPSALPETGRRSGVVAVVSCSNRRHSSLGHDDRHDEGCGEGRLLGQEVVLAAEHDEVVLGAGGGDVEAVAASGVDRGWIEGWASGHGLCGRSRTSSASVRTQPIGGLANGCGSRRRLFMFGGQAIDDPVAGRRAPHAGQCWHSGGCCCCCALVHALRDRVAFAARAVRTSAFT